jgi:release factor glutamine methyltransferase
MSFSPLSASPPSAQPPSAGPVADLVARLRAAGCVFAEEEAELLQAAAADAVELDRLTARRVAGVPLEYVLGWAEFGGQRFVVNDGVFVPRHRTEFLVELATDLAQDRQGGGVLVDLCCGSGALGAVVASRLASVEHAPDGHAQVGHAQVGHAPVRWEVHASDVDPAAVGCARRNLAPYGGQVYEGDLYAALPVVLRGCVDILLANAPYVPTGAIDLLPPEAREFEALAALDGGPDGLSVLGRVIAGAAAWLAPGGHLLMESSEEQASALVAIVTAGGLAGQIVRSEEHETSVVIGTKVGQPEACACSTGNGTGT